MPFLSKKNSNNVDKLYNKILNFSRDKFFYINASLDDNYQVRVYLIFFHISFLIIKIKCFTKNLQKDKISQELFDCAFKNIEQNMREYGYGDVVVNKNMKSFVKIFYNVLINCENYDNFNNKKKNSIFLKYFYIEKSYNKPRTIELIKYFDNYQSFCFDLSLNSVINGDLNFNHKMSLI